MRRGYRMFPVGGAIAKGELYGWLQLRPAADGFPAGYCHFPEYGEEFFKQLTAEHLVTKVHKKTHRTTLIWEGLPNRQNHHLDCRVYARAAVALLGIDRLPPAARTPAPPAASAAPANASAAAPVPAPAPAPARAPPRRESWLNGGHSSREGRGGKGWFAG
jgi:phage terminase large subunit GpA-like protein